MVRGRIRELTSLRVRDPEAVATAAAARRRAKSPLGDTGRAMVIAADHPARGATAVGGDALAMADRAELLRRLCVALERPGVTGVLGTADILEDLLLLGVLDDKCVFGSMNRGGLAGSVFEIDDRFTGYDARTIAELRFDGGKMLTRVALDDPATAGVLQNSARAVDELAERRLLAMVEPFLSHWEDGRVRNDLSPDAVVRSVAIASGLGRRSAYTWLKLPVVDDMERVLAATTLPVLLLGGDPGDADGERVARAKWWRALRLPGVQGLVVGRSLLYPADGDVAGAVDRAVGLL
ncbi:MULTISPECIES: Cgl0159 family (beta/alpha)8-fold protein [unclassified Streptomyces]|uniref:Cgl0159 family (beta/alpha)8-fold protein n=1 Tax=unclassified Streptomyces TaxID=2593676 RepID=UPI002DDC1EE9|nr:MULTISPECIES: aldolase [unclassified Streptomyces]WSF81800.1 aldolase [Streptomyces sp. NBC_01744]WSC34168.1 aldolase [Streptomyces sp. NBC_01763]WSC41890.1 aldolase [Streptomyces sp. NBC_01763]WSD22123.1 aldolase [Streptomyces sp. NBC_01751]WSD29853.1 aldolase [Streptomyces sp. NBC_01751]